jgi:hypothetical protein
MGRSGPASPSTDLAITDGGFLRGQTFHLTGTPGFQVARGRRVGDRKPISWRGLRRMVRRAAPRL